MKKYILPLGIAALILTGCSSEADEPAAATTPETTATATATATPAATTPPATEKASEAVATSSFTFETPYAGTGTLEVPGTPDPDIEAMRTELGAPTVTYLTGNYDNREGAEEFLVSSVTVYDTDGNAYDYARAKDYVFELLPGTDNPAYNDYVTFYESADSSKIAPLERADFVMVGPELPAEIAGVNVSNGYEMFGAAPVE